MTGYESVMLFCAVGRLLFTAASFVLEIFKALDKKNTKCK